MSLEEYGISPIQVLVADLKGGQHQIVPIVQLTPDIVRIGGNVLRAMLSAAEQSDPLTEPMLYITNIPMLPSPEDTKVQNISTLLGGRVKIDRERVLVSLDDKDIYLPKKEYGVLEFLARKPGVVKTRNEILEVVWHDRSKEKANPVNTHVFRLRRRLSDNIIRTVHGIGYSTIL